MFWLAREFNQPVLAWYERRATKPSALDLLWFDPAGDGPKAAGLPLDKYFRGAEVAVLRSEWDNPKALFVGFKAGDNKANHSHLDLGSFVFDAAGARWAMDLGADDYNLPGYFGAQRWNYYRLRAEGQNTLVINPTAAPDQDPAARTQIIRFKSKPERAFAIADLTPAYAKNARRVWRGIALLDRNKALVQDEIQADKPIDLWWFMHTPASVSIESDGRAANLEQVGAQLRRGDSLAPGGEVSNQGRAALAGLAASRRAGEERTRPEARNSPDRDQRLPGSPCCWCRIRPRRKKLARRSNCPLCLNGDGSGRPERMRNNAISLRQMLMPFILGAVCTFAFKSLAVEHPQGTAKIETRFFRFTLSGETGRCELLDKRTGVSWLGDTNHPRFGEVTLQVGGKPRRVDLARCGVESEGRSLVASFHPLNEQPAATLARPAAGPPGPGDVGCELPGGRCAPGDQHLAAGGLAGSDGCGEGLRDRARAGRAVGARR